MRLAEEKNWLRVGISHSAAVPGDESDNDPHDYYYDPKSRDDHNRRAKELVHMISNPMGVLEYQSPAEGQVRICLSLTKTVLQDPSFSGHQMVALRVTERVDLGIEEGEYDHLGKNAEEKSLFFPEADLTQMTPEEVKQLRERHVKLRKELLSRERLNDKSVLQAQIHEKLSKDVVREKQEAERKHQIALEQYHRDQQSARSHVSELENLLLKFVEQSEMLITSSHLVKKEEDTFQERTREMHAASRWWPMIHVCVLIATGFTQANHMVKFFKSKYIL